MAIEGEWIAGEYRRFGCLARVSGPGDLFPLYGETMPLIPRSEWKPISFRSYVAKILDQDGIGACNGFAGVQCLSVCRAMAGLPFVELSGGQLYGQMTQIDQGSMLGDSILKLKEVGVAPAYMVRQLDWKRNKWPADWQTTAKRYRITEAYDAPNFDSLVSAILTGFVVNLGILVGSNFQPAADGWIPPRGGRGGGHAICGCGVAQKGSTWGIEIANSWGTTWGDNGFGIVPESYFGDQFTDGWAVRASIQPSDEPLPESAEAVA
jgi:hypothetical protein